MGGLDLVQGPTALSFKTCGILLIDVPYHRFSVLHAYRRSMISRIQHVVGFPEILTDSGGIYLLALLLKKLLEMASDPPCTILVSPQLKELILVNLPLPPHIKNLFAGTLRPIVS